MPSNDPSCRSSTCPPIVAPRILLLGGTGDALPIARQLRQDDVYSIAGLGSAPIGLPCRVREGGFGGVTGMVHTLDVGAFGLLVDATHPYAARISANAVAAAAQCNIPYWRLERPAWKPSAMDRWIDVDDWSQTLDAARPFRRLLWTLGREPLAHIGRVAPDQHWFVRCLPETVERHAGGGQADGSATRKNDVTPSATGGTVEGTPGDDASPLSSRVTLIPARGPFTLAPERALIGSLGIDVIVSKNSGGTATDAKLQVARECGLPVIMRRRPPPAWGRSPDDGMVLSPRAAVDEACASDNRAAREEAAARAGPTTATSVFGSLRLFPSAAAVLAALSADPSSSRNR